MAVKKVGKKWYPVGKKGKPWKTGFATEAKAKAALTKANTYWKSKGTGKKKTTKKKTTKKKSGSKKSKPKGSGKTAKNRSLLGYVRLGIYAVTIGSGAINAVARHGFTKEAAAEIGRRYSATDQSGRFSSNQAIETYSPPAIWATIDTIASKTGVYKRIGSL